MDWFRKLEERLFLYGVNAKKEIIVAFTLLYLALMGGALTGWLSLGGQPGYLALRDLSLLSGKAAIIVFVITIIPGMARRFGFVSRAFQFVMLFRRQFGLTVFFLVLFHLSIVWLIPSLQLAGSLIPLATFELMGLTAFLFLIPLFLTSNDWSVRHLGPWWKRIHSLIYVIAWFIFLHVSLQQSLLWASIIGVAAVAETLSLVFKLLKRPS